MPHSEGSILAEPDKTSARASSSQRFRVLLAEDDNALRRYLEVTLQRAGYEVLLASDGIDAMKIAMAQTIDLVITDAMMPNLSGHELCRFLKNSPKLSQIPVVLLSALERKEVGDEELADAFLAKPVSVDALTKCVAGLLAGK
ncbi:MAG: response regulator [bacterium]